MTHAGINYLAALAAGVAAFLVGALWYAVFGRDGEAGRPPFAALATAFVADLVIAYVLAGAVGHLGPGQVTLRNGVISAAILWGGFVLTTLATNHAFDRRPARQIAVDAGHWLAAMLVAGAVIGAAG